MASYLDTSVIVSMLVQEARTPAIFRFLATTRDDLLVNEFTAAEVASAISRRMRRQNGSAAEANFLLARFDAWRAAATVGTDIEGGDIAHAGRLVRRFELKLRTPEALHLAVAQRFGATLVTGDGTLAAAARDCGAGVVEL